MPPRKRVRSQSPDGQSPKKTKRAMGKTSTNTTKPTEATAAEPTAQAGTFTVSNSEDGLNAGTKAPARKPAGRPAAGSRPSARGRKKATGKVHTEIGEQGNFQPATPARRKPRTSAKTHGAEADPDSDATKAKNSDFATATKTGDSTEVALSSSDSKNGTAYVPSPAELHTTADVSHAKGVPTQGRASEGLVLANPGDAVVGKPAPADFHGTPAAGQKATTTAAGPSTPTNGLRLGGNGVLSSCEPENTGEEDSITAGTPFKSIQWQRPVPSGISATGTAPGTGAWVKPLVEKPTDVLPTIEKRPSSPSLQGGGPCGLRVNEPLPEADAAHQHRPLSSHQQDTVTSALVVTEQRILQQGFQPMTVGADAKPGETLEPLGYNTALVHTTADNPGPIPKKPASAHARQLPRNVFCSLERFLNDDLLASSNQGMWLRGVQWGIGHGIVTMKSAILEEIEQQGLVFGRLFPLDPGLSRAEQRRDIESHFSFDRLVAERAGDIFMRIRRRRHGANAHPSTAPFPQAPMAYGSPVGQRHPGSTPTPPFLQRFATSAVSAGGLLAHDPRYPQHSPGFSRPSVGPWMSQSPSVSATRNYKTGDEMQSADGASPEFAALPDGLPRQSTGWRNGEFPRASPQLSTTEDGRAVISMSRRQG